MYVNEDAKLKMTKKEEADLRHDINMNHTDCCVYSKDPFFKKCFPEKIRHYVSTDSDCEI